MNIKQIIDIVKSTYPMIMNQNDTHSVSEKGDADFVTQVDLKVQKYIKSELNKRYPDIQFMGEEGEHSEIDFSKSVWILDPIDGTTNLIRHYCMSAVSLALVENNKPVLGIVYNPFHNELFYAEKGKGAFLNDKPIHVSSVDNIKNSLISIGTMPYNKTDSNEKFELYKKLFMDSIDIRRCGSAALDLSYIACGRTDVYFEPQLKPWDYAAGCVILSEAGGNVTDFSGNPVRFDINSNVLASNKLLNNKMLDYLKDLKF